MTKEKKVNSLVAGALILGIGIYVVNKFIPFGTSRLVILAAVCIIGISTLFSAKSKSKKQPEIVSEPSGLKVNESDSNEPQDSICILCGSIVGKEDDYCISCGRRVSRCTVCKQTLTTDEEIGRCPYCESENHLSHFYEWTKVNGNCPNCLQQLATEGIIRDTNY